LHFSYPVSPVSPVIPVEFFFLKSALRQVSAIGLKPNPQLLSALLEHAFRAVPIFVFYVFYVVTPRSSFLGNLHPAIVLNRVSDRHARISHEHFHAHQRRDIRQ
jgi:hypothetical protein